MDGRSARALVDGRGGIWATVRMSARAMLAEDPVEVELSLEHTWNVA